MLSRLEQFVHIERRGFPKLGSLEMLFWECNRAKYLQAYLDASNREKNNSTKSSKVGSYFNAGGIKAAVISTVQLASIFLKRRKYKKAFVINERTMSICGTQYRDNSYNGTFDGSDVCIVIPDVDSKRRKFNLHYNNVIRLDSVFIIELLIKKILGSEQAESNFENSKLIELAPNVVSDYKKQCKALRFRKIILAWIIRRLGIEEAVLKSSYSPFQKVLASCAGAYGSVKLIEYQHAFVYKDHPGYSKPSEEVSNIFRFPDSFVCYENQSKKNLEDMGWSDSRLLLDEATLANDLSYDHQGDDVLIVCQLPAMKDLVVCLERIKTTRNILVKLHPRDVNGQLKYLEPIKGRNNIRIVDGQYSIDAALKRCSVVVGSYSTVLFDAMQLEKKVIIINKKGADVFSDFVDNGKMEYVDVTSSNELVLL